MDNVRDLLLEASTKDSLSMENGESKWIERCYNRNKVLSDLRKGGFTYADIAEMCGLSEERTRRAIRAWRKKYDNI
jgi:DNA-directed RNA polymerase specialized sigma24 family protein